MAAKPDCCAVRKEADPTIGQALSVLMWWRHRQRGPRNRAEATHPGQRVTGLTGLLRLVRALALALIVQMPPRSRYGVTHDTTTQTLEVHPATPPVTRQTFPTAPLEGKRWSEQCQGKLTNFTYQFLGSLVMGRQEEIEVSKA